MFRIRGVQPFSRQRSLFQEHQGQTEGHNGNVGLHFEALYSPHSHCMIDSSIDGILGTENREQLTFEKHQALASSKTNAFRMPPGDHAFLFDIPLPCKILETVTGPKHQYHTYRVEIVIERRLKNDLVISQPVRIYQISDFNTSYLRPYCPLVCLPTDGMKDLKLILYRHLKAIRARVSSIAFL